MREKYRVDKDYPIHASFNIGDEFIRCPKEIHFNPISGTYPLYGRVVLSTERVGEHKLMLTLGEVNVKEPRHEISDEAVVAVYGEIDEFVSYDEADEFSKLWLSTDEGISNE